MTVRYSTGYKFNALTSAVSVTASLEDPNYPISAVKDGRLSVAFKSAAGSNPTISANLDVLTNGNFNTSTLASWTDASSGGGSTSEEGTIVVSGKALKMTTSGGASTASRYQDVLIRAGKKYNISAKLRGDGTRTARLRLYFPEYGYYVDNAGALSAAATDVASNATTSYVKSTVSFSTPSASLLLGSKTVVARVILINNTASGGSAYADDVALWPSWNMVSIHGHNLKPATVVSVISSPDNFSTTYGVGLMSVKPYRFYMLSDVDVDEQYAMISFTTDGLGSEPGVSPTIEITEIVLTMVDALAKGFNWPYKFQVAYDQTRTQLGSGIRIYNTRTMPRLTLSMDWQTKSAAQFAEIRDELMQNSGHGHYPILWIPNDSDEVVIFGRLPNQYTPAKERDLNDFSLIIVEMPYTRVATDG